MKNKIKKIIVLSVVLCSTVGFLQPTETVNYKCMIQLTNYSGEGAYIVVSLLNADGEYEDTLYVQGDDNEWYRDIEDWWKNVYGIRRPELDAVTGATVSGGERSTTVLKIPLAKINKGYSIRFESAVEDQEYYTSDLEFEVTTENLKAKKEGNGFIRYVRMIAQ
ncbi:DUF2271 domain-containing protein [Maribacter antarcticus]|uniref:DUF2271 domain-containing protein n=1 Tax=Maribacter antarcticus TaxID=505250 RepID=UPI00047D7C7E|nr:DUF2271 domain-containing protein [Maribacter antarcticus]